MLEIIFTDLVLRFLALRCLQCEGPVVEGKCLDCDSGEAGRDDNHLLDLAGSEDLDQLKLTEKCQAETLYRHHEALAKLRDKIAMLEVDRGQYGEALRMLRLGVEYTTVRYGEDSIELGHELLKLSDVMLARLQEEGGDQRDLVTVLRQALTIFRTHHGKDSVNCKEINQKLEFFASK